MAVLRAEAVSKRYGGTTALDAVDFPVESGKVHVLIGENGAGKSTLMRILAGIEQPDAGSLFLDNAPMRFEAVRDAAACGIGIVHQELNLCPNLTVAENIFLAQPAGSGALVDAANERKETATLMARLEQNIDPATPVSDLRIGQQQIVEIAKALANECRVLIMDEPTSALSASEVQVLFRVIGELKRAGVAIVYISHRLEELLRIGDVITVMRSGRIVDSAPAASVSVPWIIERMLGETGRIAREARTKQAGAPVIELDELCFDRGVGRAPVNGLTAAFKADTITAIYGLLGSGRTELFEALCGARRAHAGTIRLLGLPIEHLDIAQRVERGLLLVPEDRQREGLFPNLSVGRNLEMSDLDRQAAHTLIDGSRIKAAIAAMIARLGIKAFSPDTSIDALSGGNQQKVVIGRTLMPGPSVLLLDEPSRGIDVGARAEVFATMQELAEGGLCVVFSTSDVLEALTIADRILVMAEGKITLDIDAAKADESTIINAANLAAQPTAVH